MTPTAMAKLHALEPLYKHTLPTPVTLGYSSSDTHPNTIIEKSCMTNESECVRVQEYICAHEEIFKSTISVKG